MGKGKGHPSRRYLEIEIKKHLKTPFPIHYHSSSTGHPFSPDCITIIQREAQGTSGNIKEAMFIHVNDHSLNRNLGKFQLPHIWDILQDTPVLQLKYFWLPLHLSLFPYLSHPFPYPINIQGVGHLYFFFLVSIPFCGGASQAPLPYHITPHSHTLPFLPLFQWHKLG